MSYDLYLYKQKNSNLTADTIADYFNNNLPFNNNDYANQWSYENPETGVYFMIDRKEPDEKSENNIDGFDDLNFSITINFFRPTYFGLEIFPIIENMVKKMDLYILNPQDEKDPDNPQKFSDGYLQDQWIKQNNQISIDSFKRLGFNYMNLEKSNYMWLYLLYYNELENNIKDDIFIPHFFIIKKHDDGQLITASVWPNHVPILLPKVDYLIIQKKYKKFFRSIEEDGVISYENVMKELGHYFEDYNYPLIPDLKILKQANADKMADKFNSLKIYKSIKDFGVSVSKDGFVNVHPE